MKKMIFLIRCLIGSMLAFAWSIGLSAQCEPVCVNGLVFEWNMIDTAIEASVLIENTAELEACGGEITYSIHNMGDMPDISQTYYLIDCEDLLAPIQVEVAAWQDGVLMGSCPTYVLIQDNLNQCDFITDDSTFIFGSIKTWCDEPVVGMPVFLNNDTTYTNNNGYYNFEIPVGGDYTITAPTYYEDYTNGVDTSDMNLISQAILLVDPDDGFTSPYQYLATDVDHSMTISTFDLLQISMLVQGFIDEFNGPSWFCIPDSYNFPIPNNPWFENYPEVINLNNITGDVMVNWVAVKAGDVNCSADPYLNTPGPATIQGVLFEESGSNCSYDNNELTFSNWIVQAESTTETYYTTTDSNGYYNITLPAGDYILSSVPPNNLWEACSDETPISLSADQFVNIDLGHFQTQLCPFMEFDIAALELVPCQENIYQIRYCNRGNVIAPSAQIDIVFDQHLSVTGSDVNYISNGGGSYSFLLGDVMAGKCGSFSISAFLECDVLAGQSHCLSARISPDDICAIPDTEWDGSKIELNVECLGDEVEYTIHNIGADMVSTRSCIVIEDDLVMLEFDIKLLADEYYFFTRAANGTTQRIEMAPAPGPYRLNTPNASVELCGANQISNPSLGFVTVYNNESGYPFERQICQENTTVETYNDKIAAPKGLGMGQYIYPDNRLQYQIRFQNDNNETAQNMLIQDLLPDGVEPGSIQLGASSHPYTFTLSETGLASFFFEDINLPSSAVDEAESKGFVRFSVEQEGENPNGLIIENNALISFDFNTPLTTNYAWHTIEESFLDTLPPITISATIEREDGLPVEAFIYLINEMGDTVNQTYNNTYSFEIPGPGIYQVVPFKQDSILNGVSTFDMLLLSRHILGIQPFDSPYKIIAGDLNNSGSLTTMDLIAMRKRILNLTESFPNVPDWRFVRADYVFPDPANPWFEVFPESGTMSFPENPNIDFIAIKMGDFNLDWMPFQSEDLEERRSIPLWLQPTDEGGEVILAKSQEISAFQLSIDQFPPFQSITTRIEGAQQDYYYENGHLRLISYTTQPTFMEAGDVLFSWKGDRQGRSTSFCDEFSKLYDQNGQFYQPVLIHQDLESYSSVKLSPNPVRDWLTVKGESMTGEINIRVSNAWGQEMYQSTIYSESSWQHPINMEQLPVGVYWVEITSGQEECRELISVVAD
jgi:uncharacterized repeat protein (TIGR01451 family)